MNDDSKKGAWFKWIAGSIIALIGAGGGLIAVLQYLDSRNEAADREYRQALANWRSFSPQPISRGPQSIELRGGDRFDLETGLATSNPGQSSAWDLLFACHPNARESLRAADGVEWSDLGVVTFSAVGYRQIRDANFLSRRHPQTNYKDLYLAHISNVPGNGYSFAIKTDANNVALFQISGYRSVNPNPNVCRNMTVRYEVYPIVADPARPRRP